jgi:selenocysteine lyase/cysteine desulfurase
MNDPYPIGKLRKLFPVSREMTYLNHAAVSPYSTRVHEAVTRHAGEVLQHGGQGFHDWLDTRERLRRLVAGLVHTMPERIAFVKNTSEGINQLAAGLDWQTGDRIILADCEFPANVYPFLHAARHGVELDFVRTLNGFLTLDDFEQLITPRTRLIAVSFVEFVNGFRNNLNALGELCQRKNILLSVDAIQGLGALPLDVEECRIDFLACGAHKWLMAPSGIGFIYVRPELMERLTMSHVGWLSVKDAWNFFDFRLDLVDDARRYELATENWVGIYGMHASVGLLMETGIEAIHRHLISILDPLIAELQSMGCRIASSLEPEHRSGILSPSDVSATPRW